MSIKIRKRSKFPKEAFRKRVLLYWSKHFHSCSIAPLMVAIILPRRICKGHTNSDWQQNTAIYNECRKSNYDKFAYPDSMHVLGFTNTGQN
jgi:hypothetical protein